MSVYILFNIIPDRRVNGVHLDEETRHLATLTG